MLDDLIQQILGHFHLHRSSTGQVLPADETVVRVPYTIYDQPGELFIKRGNLYVYGYVGNGQAYCVGDAPMPAQIATSLDYGADYMALGWNRTANPIITVTEGDIGGALASAAAGAKLGRTQFLYLALFMEAIRFVDVSELIKRGEPINKTRLDWQQQINAGNARVRQSNHAASPLLV